MSHPVASGRINDAKKCLMRMIEESAVYLKEGKPQADLKDKVFGDWTLAMEVVYGPVTGLKLPVVTVRISPARIWQAHYARRTTPAAGDMGIYSFTAHVFHKRCMDAGEEKYKDCQDLADRIMWYLTTRRWEAEEDCAICDIYDVQARESEPRGGPKSQRVCRIIIEGFMLIQRADT